jgi:hypothetical protein
MSGIESVGCNGEATQLNSLLASHQVASSKDAWTHRDDCNGKLYRFQPGSTSERQLLLHFPELAPTLGTTRPVHSTLRLQARVLPLPARLEQYIEHSGAIRTTATGRVPRKTLLHGFRCWSRDWDTPARRVVAAMMQLGFVTYRSHGVRYWLGLEGKQ